MSAIIMKCLLLRLGGTKIDLDGTHYHFKDDGLGNHVATMTNMKHVSRLAGIPEAYEIFDGGAAETDAATALGVTLTAPVVVAPVVVEASAPVLAPALVATVEPTVVADAPEMKTTINAIAGFPENMSKDELRAVFLAEVGREPSAKAKPETMMATIIAVREERAGK